MTWQDPGTDPVPGGPGGPEDATRADWDLAHLDALVGNVGGGPAAVDPPPPPSPEGVPQPDAPAGPPPAPAPPPAWSGSVPGPVPGYAPGMTWEPPSTYGGPGVPGAGGLVFAGVLERFVAWLVDMIILGLVGGAIVFASNLVLLGTMNWSAAFGLGTRGPAFDGGLFGSVILVALVSTVLSAAIDLAYFALLWTSGSRATLGMLMFGLQIGNAADGRILGRGQAVKRWVAMGGWLSIGGVVPVVGGLVGLVQVAWYLVLLISTASNPRRQGIHDQLAETAIVQRAGESRSGLAIGCLVLIVLLVVIPVISVLAIGFAALVRSS